MPLWLRPPFWFVHSLANFLPWTGRCCLYPQGSRDYKVSNKVRERYYCKTRRFWDWNLLVDCRCNACLQDYSDTHPGGTDGLISREPSMLHELRTSLMCTIRSAVFGDKEETLCLLSLCFSTRGGGTWSPAFCLCRTLPCVDLRTHTHPWGSQIRTPLLTPSFTRCI